MKQSAVLLMALACSLGAMQAQETQTSPDGNIQLTFDLKDGVPYYSLSYKGQEVIKPSRLGLELVDDYSLTDNFSTGKIERSTFDETWTPVWGESSTIRNHYNEMAVTLTQQQNDKKATEYGGNPRYMTLRFRVYDDGIGFRYEFPEQRDLIYFVIRKTFTV